MAAGGLDGDSWRSSVRKASCKFEAERPEVSNERRRRQKSEQHPEHPQANLRLSKVWQVLRTKNRSVQPTRSMQELTINLPQNPRLRGISHHHHRVGCKQKPFRLFYNCIVPLGFLPWEIWVAFPGVSQISATR